MSLLLSADRTFGAGQTSMSFRVQADVFSASVAPLAIGSAHFQATVSVAQNSLAAETTTSVGGRWSAETGFQAASQGLDTDGDGIPDSASSDADADGLVNAVDPRPYDTDGDALNNIDDPDDDNDGLPDTTERLVHTSLVRVDTDGDTQSDYIEWAAGTDGTNPREYFKLDAARLSSGEVELRWQGQAGALYVITATNALSTLTGWPTLWATTLVSSGTATYRDAAPGAKRFYRITIP